MFLSSSRQRGATSDRQIKADDVALPWRSTCSLSALRIVTGPYREVTIASAKAAVITILLHCIIYLTNPDHSQVYAL